MNANTFPCHTDEPCPQCGGKLTIDEVLIPTTIAPAYFDRRSSLSTLAKRLRPAVAKLCSGCEFAIEIVR